MQKGVKLAILAVWAVMLTTISGCFTDQLINPQKKESLPFSTAGLPPERTEELEVADISLNAFELEGNPLYVMFDTMAVEQDSLSIETQLNRGIRNVLTDNLVKVERPSQKRSIQQFRTELKLANKTGDSNYEGKQIVNYVMTGSLELSTFRDRYENPPLHCTLRKEDCEGRCEYRVGARLSLEVERFPELRRVNYWTLETTAEDSFRVAADCPAHNPQQPHQLFTDLVDKVAKRLIECSRTPLEDFFLSQGYVTNYYSDGSRFMFVTTGGRAAGFDRGDNVVIEHFDAFSVTPGEGSRDGIYRVIAEAKVVEVFAKHAVLSVEDQPTANRVMINDRVRPKPKRRLPNLACVGVLKS